MRDVFAGVYFAQDNIIFAHQVGQYSDLAEMPKNDQVAPKDWQANLDIAAEHFAHLAEMGTLKAIGLAVPGSFKINLDVQSSDYGFLGNNPGPIRWRNFNVRDELLIRLKAKGLKKLPRVAVVSQVGATSFGDFVTRFPEYFRKENPDLDRRFNSRNLLYIVADAGIGVSLIANGELFSGEAVPTIGNTIVHVRPETLIDGQLPAPSRYHPGRPTLNSVASLGAIEAKWGLNPDQYIETDNKEVIQDVAFYIAQALTTHAFLLSPKQIVVGGRIAKNPKFMPELMAQFRAQVEDWDDEVEPSYAQLHDVGRLFMELSTPHAGVIGALKVAAGYEYRTPLEI